MKNKLFIFLISLIVVFSSFIFIVKAEEGKVEVPETVGGAKEVLMNMIKVGREQLPQSIKSMWDEEVLPVWGRMLDWFKVNIGSKVGEIIKQREPEVKQDFEEEKGEMAQDIKKEAPNFSQYLKTFWQEIKNLFSNN